MDQRRFWRNITRIHKWAGLIIGIQIFLWFGSGFFMSAFPIKTVRGEHLVDKSPPQFEAAELAPISTVLAAYGEGATSIRLSTIAGMPAYRIEGENGAKLFDGRTGGDWTAPGAETVKSIARQYYIGDGKLTHAIKLDRAPIDYRGPLPVWQVKFNDGAKTRLYIDPDTTELRSTRTRLWRVFDFMWMLHIMDYDERDDINNWFLRLASFFAFLFAITGFFLLFHRIVLRPRISRQK